MKKEYDKSYPYNQFWDYIPTEERYFFSFFVIAIKLCLLLNIFVHNTKQQCKKHNSNS